MSQSISKAQAELLASQFLNGLGSNPELNDLELNETLTALIMLAGLIINESNKNLQEGGHISSGDLSSSLKVLDPEMFGKSIRLSIEALKYYQFLNRGVKGTRGGSGEYSFKSSYPSKGMIDKIEQWIKRAGLASFNVKKPISKLEAKRKSVSQMSATRNTAYAVARSIKMHGIKKTGFFDKAIKVAQQHAKEELSKALKADVINSLPKQLGNDDK